MSSPCPLCGNFPLRITRLTTENEALKAEVNKLRMKQSSEAVVDSYVRNQVSMLSNLQQLLDTSGQLTQRVESMNVPSSAEGTSTTPSHDSPRSEKLCVSPATDESHERPT
jgi:hypothetical protein